MGQFFYDIKILVIGILLGIVIFMAGAATQQQPQPYRPFGFTVRGDERAIIERRPGEFFVVDTARRRAEPLEYRGDAPPLDMPPRRD